MITHSAGYADSRSRPQRFGGTLKELERRLVFESIHTLRCLTHGGGVAFRAWGLGKRSSAFKRLRVAGAFAFFAGVSIRDPTHNCARVSPCRVKSHRFSTVRLQTHPVCSWCEFFSPQSTVETEPAFDGVSPTCLRSHLGFLSDCVVAAFWLPLKEKNFESEPVGDPRLPPLFGLAAWSCSTTFSPLKYVCTSARFSSYIGLFKFLE